MACLPSRILLTLSPAQSRMSLSLYFKILWIPGFPEKRRRDRPEGGGGGGYLGKFFAGYVRAGLLEPLPHFSLFCDQL